MCSRGGNYFWNFRTFGSVGCNNWLIMTSFSFSDHAAFIVVYDINKSSGKILICILFVWTLKRIRNQFSFINFQQPHLRNHCTHNNSSIIIIIISASSFSDQNAYCLVVYRHSFVLSQKQSKWAVERRLPFVKNSAEVKNNPFAIRRPVHSPSMK